MTDLPRFETKHCFVQDCKSTCSKRGQVQKKTGGGVFLECTQGRLGRFFCKFGKILYVVVLLWDIGFKIDGNCR